MRTEVLHRQREGEQAAGQTKLREAAFQEAEGTPLPTILGPTVLMRRSRERERVRVESERGRRERERER